MKQPKIMYKSFLTLIISLSIFIEISIHAHGFAANTLIKTTDGWFFIKELCKSKVRNIDHHIVSYDSRLLNIEKQLLQSVGASETQCYFRIGCDNYYDQDILCTPTQEFYLLSLERWIPAFKLKAGDALLNEDKTVTVIVRIECIQQPIKVYALEIQHNHIYVVSPHAVLTHNMILPMILNTGLRISFGSGVALGGATGSFFGPLTFAGGIVVGGLIGIGINIFSNNKDVLYYNLLFDRQAINVHLKNSAMQDKSDAQAPGIPTADDGYIPPKNWDGKKMKHPKNGQVGWPDNQGNIWVPTGVGPKLMEALIGMFSMLMVKIMIMYILVAK